MSADSIAVRDRLRTLDPAEGLAVIAWLLDRLPHSVELSGVTQARRTGYMRSLLLESIMKPAVHESVRCACRPCSGSAEACGHTQ